MWSVRLADGEAQARQVELAVLRVPRIADFRDHDGGDGLQSLNDPSRVVEPTHTGIKPAPERKENRYLRATRILVETGDGVNLPVRAAMSESTPLSGGVTRGMAGPGRSRVVIRQGRQTSLSRSQGTGGTRLRGLSYARAVPARRPPSWPALRGGLRLG